MTNGLEYRGETALGGVTDLHPGDHTFSLCIVKYNGGESKRADSYGSVWSPGVFTDSLTRRMPAAAYAHNWERIIGSLKEHDERADGLHGLVQLANIDEVPDAKLAWSLMRDGHLRDTSFGFKRIPGGWDDTRSVPGRIEGEKERLRNARLDEVSPVLVGAVHGAGVLAVRSASGDSVSVATAADLFTKLAAGQITLRDALEALEKRDGKAMTPHAFVEDQGDQEHDCKVCGGPASAPIHTKRAAFVEPTDLSRNDVEDAWTLMFADGLIRRQGMIELRTQNHSASLERLIRYWAHGEGAAKIGWDTSGDFARCEAALGKYVPPNELKGFCARLHKEATGAWPGHAAGEQTGRSDARESETEPSPT